MNQLKKDKSPQLNNVQKAGIDSSQRKTKSQPHS